MDLNDFIRLLPLLNSGGILALAFFFLYLFISGRVRSGDDYHKLEDKYEDMRRDRDDWKTIATRGTDQIGNLVQAAQLLTQVNRRE